MIFKAPTPGDLTDWLMEPYQEPTNAPAPMLHDANPARPTQVLGPDGEPVMAPVPRRVIGFDLRPKQSEGE